MPTGPKTRMWTYNGTFPGPTIKRPTGSLTKVTFVHDLPKRSRLPDRAPARRPPELGRRRAAHPLPHRPRIPPHVHLPAHRRRRADTGGVPLLPRPPDGPDRQQQLARSPGHVPGHRHSASASSACRVAGTTSRCTSPIAASPPSNQLTDPFPGPHMHDWLTGPQAPPDDATVGKRILVNGQFAPYLTVEARAVPAPAAELGALLGLRLRPLQRPSASSRSAPGTPCSPRRWCARTSSSVRPNAPTWSSTSRGLRNQNVAAVHDPAQ